VLEARLVGGPVARQEDEAEEHHARADEGQELERPLEDDEDVAVHPGRVGAEPHVHPVGVELRARQKAS
jgi:predicted fused transcriptional regulator/phosphomethylpyrimidine kinase